MNMALLQATQSCFVDIKPRVDEGNCNDIGCDETEM